MIGKYGRYTLYKYTLIDLLTYRQRYIHTDLFFVYLCKCECAYIYSTHVMYTCIAYML